MIKNKLTYVNVFSSLISAVFFTLLNACLPINSFLSVSLLNALLYLGTSAIGTFIAFVLGFLVNFNISKFFCGVISAILVCPIYALMKKKKILIAKL